MRDYLNDIEKLEFSLKELMSIVYNSNRQLNEKLRFYKDIKDNFELNDEDRKNIIRLIGACERVPSSIFSIYDNELINNNSYNKYPEHLYIYLPSPFKLGDIVREVGDYATLWVVIDPELPSGDLIELCDNFDMCITVVPVKYRYLATKKYLREREIKYKKIKEQKGYIDFEELDEISRYHQHLMIFDLVLVENSRI